MCTNAQLCIGVSTTHVNIQHSSISNRWQPGTWTLNIYWIPDPARFWTLHGLTVMTGTSDSGTNWEEWWALPDNFFFCEVWILHSRVHDTYQHFSLHQAIQKNMPFLTLDLHREIFGLLLWTEASKVAHLIDFLHAEWIGRMHWWFWCNCFQSFQHSGILRETWEEQDKIHRIHLLLNAQASDMRNKHESFHRTSLDWILGKISEELSNRFLQCSPNLMAFRWPELWGGNWTHLEKVDSAIGILGHGCWNGDIWEWFILKEKNKIKFDNHSMHVSRRNRKLPGVYNT